MHPSSAQPVEAVHQVLAPYGVGIDTHSKFIAVCILTKTNEDVKRSERDFGTNWPDLVRAHKWVLERLGTLATPDTLRYCIESTGTYHFPVLRAWRGIPTVVNPMLAAPTRRKTDVLDARLLAHHSITGMWPASFIPTEQAQELRVIWAQRREAARLATRTSNRINNIILRFGHTIGAEHAMRTSMAEGAITDLIEGRVPKISTICPDGLPVSMRPVLAELLTQMHEASESAHQATVRALNFIKAREWPSATGPVQGPALLKLLSTVPGVGETTAITWLAEVCDPRRFQHMKQVAAYCGCDPSLKTSAGKVTSFVRRSGNTRMHHALLYAAAGLLQRKREMIGIWGASIQGRHKKGGYRKACGAIARRIAVGLWHVHSKGQAFSYAGYHLADRPMVKNIPIKEMVNAYAFRILKDNGFKTSQAVADAYFAGKLTAVPSFGASSLEQVKSWVQLNTISRHPKPDAKPGLSTDKKGKKVYTVKLEA